MNEKCLLSIDSHNSHYSYLLRGLGAFYIKRKIDKADGKKDYIYRSLLQAYLQESICAGHNIEFFIEGGRTRTGKPNMPKVRLSANVRFIMIFLNFPRQSGILSVIVEAFMDGLIDDAILVPVSVNYEKLVDGNFVNEQLGTPKKKESFRAAMASIWKVLNAKYGFMRIDFNEPFSLKELVKSFKERQVEIATPSPSARQLMSGISTNSMYGIEVVDKHRALVDNIARHVVFDCSYATSVMSTNVVAYILLNKYRRGATMKELTIALSELRDSIETERDLGFEGESESVVERAVELLGPDLVQRQLQANGETFIRPVLSVPNVIETAYYSNTFVPYFALDAVVVSSVGTVNEGAPMGINDVIETAMLYCDILRYEFFFYKPCQNFAEQIEKSLEKMCKLGNLTRINKSDCVSLNFQSSRTLLSSLAPFNIAYITVIECLQQLVDASPMLEKDFVKIVLNRIKEKLSGDEITYGESISTDSIKNCVKLMEKWTVVEAETLRGVRKISLSSACNSILEVQNVIDKVGKFVILK